jgi:DNA-binding PucR family transcriptional regulator
MIAKFLSRHLVDEAEYAVQQSPSLVELLST